MSSFILFNFFSRVYSILFLHKIISIKISRNLLIFQIIIINVQYQLTVIQRLNYNQIQIQNMYNSNYTDRAIPLVAVNENTGKYQMAEEAIKFLRSVPAPLGIVSVAGLYRTGKSYLLNRMLLNTNKPKQGFGVGPTINPCTKGLWCWGTPIKGKSQTGESINIIVIDTEGIGALDEDQTHDTRIFTLAILSSSCFIYNSVGSIDETAVQNLSLVVNLTKHIQLKSTNKSFDEDEDSDEIAHYFPSFYWVIRDFSLQLQDTHGKSITSKQYLQKALAPIKGSSQFDEDVEEKNRIRKLLVSFFKDRDCFTMVRPLVDETKLQDLDGIPFEQLRPDFIEQVIQFRKRVTQGLKIKTLNGNQLNGDMYCNMLLSYVTAMNDGAVPNIENAWNYMCREQCQKIQYECESIFDKQLRDNMKFPVEQEYFETTCENAFEQAMIHFREKALGQMSVSLKYEKQLKEKLKQKVKNSREDNIKASKQFLQKKVLEVFNPIMQQLKKQHFKTFEEFQKTINTTYENLVNNSPNLPFTRQKYLELYKKVQRQGAEYIFKCLSKQMQNMKSIFKEKQQYYLKQLETIKYDQDNDRKSYSTKISEMDKEKIETQNKIQRLQFELQKLMKEKQSETEKLSKNLTSKQSEFESNRKQFENKFQQIESRYEEVSRNFAKQQKIWEKDRAIMQNKIKQQNMSIQELEKEKQIITLKYEEINNESNLNLKQTMNRNEKRFAEMQNELKKLKDIKFQLTENLKTVKDELEERAERFERSDKKLKQQLSNKKRELQSLKTDFEIQKKKIEQQLQDEKDKMSRTRSNLSDDFKRQKDIVSQITEQLRKTRADAESRLAELDQRIKFSEDEKRFLKEQFEENKRIHTRQIEDLKVQSNQVIEEREKVRIEEVRTQLVMEIKSITVNYENEIKKYTYDLENLRNFNKDTQLEIKVLKQQLQDEKKNIKHLQEESSERIRYLEQELKNLERVKESTLIEKESLLKKKILDLESQIQYIKDKNETDQRETQQRNKQCIIQLRVSYENQRQDMQNNYLRQKERTQRKFDEMVEEYENKHRQQIENLEQELSMLKQDTAIMQDELRNALNELRYAVDAKDKDIENLKNHIADLRAQLAKKEEQLKAKTEYLILTHKQEKQILNSKLQTLQQDFNQSEKELMNINHEKQRLSNEFQKTKNTLRDLQDEYNIKKQEYLNFIDQYKKKLTVKENDLMELKINYEKQTALLSQENQHITDKNNQLQFELNRINEVNEQKIKKIKAEAEQTVNITIEKYSLERNQIQEKYDKYKKTAKENESAMNKKLNDMEKEKAVDTQKISNLEMKLANLQERRRLQVSNIEKQFEKLKEIYKTEKSTLTNDVNRLKDQIEKISREKLDIETKYDKDILLLRNEVQNHINIKEAKQISYNENIKQLQMRIENLQRSKSSEQSKAENIYNQQRVRIEETYRTKITESNKIIEKMTRDYDDISKRYDYEVKDLREMLAVERQAKQALQNKLDKKMNEWQQLERRMIQDLDILKSEREQRGLEFQKQLEKEKQSLKLKLNDLENRLRASEKQKSSQFMDYERQKARYSQQFSNTIQEMEHLKDKISKLEKDKSRLDKQNERLKIEKRNTKNASYIRFNTGLEERKSQITVSTIRKEKIQKKETNDYRYEDSDNKENLSSQQMLLD